MMRQLVGQSLDRYQLVSLLGEGGMGAVFRARDVTLQRDVAIKVMHPRLAQRPNFRERFLQEARSAARMDHLGIVQVHDFGQAHSLLYIVMEFIPGDNLHQLLLELKAQGKWIPMDEAVQLVRQVCLALDYAHRQGVLHRDVKPSNIMLKPESSDGLPYRPVFTDLGLAKLIGGDLVTQEATSMGTPAYMSPEQALGQPTDARSDVYSLGVLLYELAVGRPPFPAKTITEAIRYHTKESPPSPRSIHPNLPPLLERVILKALEKDPGDRFPGAAALAKALEDVVPPATEIVATATTVEEGLETTADVSQDRIQIQAPGKPTRSLATTIEAGRMTIGRDEDNDIVLDDSKVSRHHARVKFDGTDYHVVDLGSTNGTFLGKDKLKPGSPGLWTPEAALRIGHHWLHLVRDQQSASSGPFRAGDTMVEPSQVPSSPGEGWVGVSMETVQPAVRPGSSITVSIALLNRGPKAERLQISLEGVPDGWVPSPMLPVELSPGEKREMTFTIRPPRSPRSRAGRYPITVRVTSQVTLGQVAEVKGTLTVAAYSQFSSKLHPHVIQAGETARITIENRGNIQETFNVQWQDRADELAFESPRALTVPAGRIATAEFRAAPRRRRWIGGEKNHPFTAQVSSTQGRTQTYTGELVSKGLVPTWVTPAVAVLLIATWLVLVYFVMRPPVIRRITVAPPNPEPGQPVVVSWRIDNAQSVELWPSGIKLDSSTREYTFEQGFDGPTDLTVVASNRFGSVEETLTIAVAESTLTPTDAPTLLPIATDTPTLTDTHPLTDTPTNTPTPTPTNTPTPTPTNTPTPTPTNTPTPTPTNIPTPTPTNIPTPIAPSDVSITGLPTGVINKPYIFHVAVSPDTATLPFTYTWQATDYEPVLHTGCGLSNTGHFTWTTTGTKTITVSATNVAGTAAETYDVTISVPPTGVTIDGPTEGVTNTGHTFTATVSPVIATQPLTYTWQATDYEPALHTGCGLSDTVHFTWTTTGTKTITVSATNVAGRATEAYRVIISATSVDVGGPTKAAIHNACSFTAMLNPSSPSPPVTYNWRATDQPPVTRMDRDLGDTAIMDKDDSHSFAVNPGDCYVRSCPTRSGRRIRAPTPLSTATPIPPERPLHPLESGKKDLTREAGSTSLPP